MKVRQFVFILAASVLCSVPSASAQSATHSASLPSNEEIRDLTTKAGEKVHAFKKTLAAASPFLEKEKVAEYSKPVDIAETIIQAMNKNGATAYSLVALVTTLDDMDMDALRSSLQILSKLAAGQITGEANQQKAISSVMALSDLDGSISDISELILHTTLRYVSAEEAAIQALGQKLKN